jgi:Family of unknown function (DUF6295)
MCSYIVEKTAVEGSAKGPNGWMRIDTANVFFDHPYHAPFSHVLGIDFVREADGAAERVAVELTADSARALVKSILAALDNGEAAHA